MIYGCARAPAFHGNGGSDFRVQVRAFRRRCASSGLRSRVPFRAAWPGRDTQTGPLAPGKGDFKRMASPGPALAWIVGAAAKRKPAKRQATGARLCRRFLRGDRHGPLSSPARAAAINMLGPFRQVTTERPQFPGNRTPRRARVAGPVSQKHTPP